MLFKVENNKDFKEESIDNNEKMPKKEEELLKFFKQKLVKFPTIKNPEINIPNEIKIKVRENIIKILEDKQKRIKGDRNLFI